MDTDRSPGVGPLAWVTLGLLAFSWLLLSGLLAWDYIRMPPIPFRVSWLTVIWLLTAGPHLMLVAAVLRSGKNPDVVLPALLLAVLYAGSSAAVGIGELTGLDWQKGKLVGCYLWLLGWPIGVVALRAAF